ncbi:CRISPR-associated endonuclease/helicase Cas3 [Desulfitispora alkaliphila]|uniref:CRISPR-associated helicase Cas3' n=1 Tax=Desulfitispora alkaliphila TaxID=622674 RepID=UPI003D2542DA
MYYAHSREGEPKEKWQSLYDHLTSTAEIAASFADKFGAKELGYTIGLLHDIGKYSEGFQRRLEGDKELVDHSTAGLKEVYKAYADKKAFAKIMGYTICGHHSGLPNSGSENQEGSLYYRMNKKLKSIENYSSYAKEIKIPDLATAKFPLKKSNEMYFSCYLFIKMLYSCLVDADFLDTEYFMDREKGDNRGGYSSIEDLLSLLNDELNKMKSSAKKSEINKRRQEILTNCVEKADSKNHIFSLTVPTGGGKTLSSMAFALNHARINEMERVIYVIPYTSIIEQNAKVFREIFGNENVLEHHSNYQFEDKEVDDNDLDVQQKLKLASENWDIPIVVTTSVQFFESLFSNKSSRSRKLHNLAKSVIILDEAQMLPVKYLQVCLLALFELVKHYHTSVVLCTATQPNLNNDKLLPSDISIQELMENPQELYRQFRRTRVNNLGELEDEDLIGHIRDHNQVLCIVNRREHARILYEKLGEKEGVFHLSTKMYPLHRQRTLSEIKERLANGQVCKVIATQLIEAGVDVDFPVVYRAIAGIDSIAQAAGRCNREGRVDCADVYVFMPTEKHAQPPKEIELNVSEARSVFRNFEDPLSIEGINKYFHLLYNLKNTDSKDIVKDVKAQANKLDYSFADIAEEFKLIENKTIAIIVPEKDNEECEKLIEQLKYAPIVYQIVRKLQPYTVNVYENEFKELLSSGGVAIIDQDKRFYGLTDTERFYDESTGIKCDSDVLTKSILVI